MKIDWLMVAFVPVLGIVGWLASKWAAEEKLKLNKRLAWIAGVIRSLKFQPYQPPADLEENKKRPKEHLRNSLAAWGGVYSILIIQLVAWMSGHRFLLQLGLYALSLLPMTLMAALTVMLINRFYGNEIMPDDLSPRNTNSCSGIFNIILTRLG